MSRSLRIERSNGIYHIINRGNYRQDLFINEGAHGAFERCLLKPGEMRLDTQRLLKLNMGAAQSVSMLTSQLKNELSERKDPEYERVLSKHYEMLPFFTSFLPQIQSRSSGASWTRLLPAK